MKTDQELEQLVRATFTGRAQTVTHGPLWTGDRVNAGPSAEADPHDRRRRWIAALAAAAAVVAVVASVTVLRDDGNHSPATSPTPVPTGSPSPSVSSTTSSVATPVTTACSTTLPSAWKSALAQSVVHVGPYSAYPLSITPGGDLLALQDDGVSPGQPRQVVELRPGRSSVVLYTVPDPDKTSVAGADEIGHWLVLALQDQPRSPKGVEPGSSPIGLSGIAVLDLQSGHVTQLATTQNATGGRSIKSSVIFDGQVYWDEEATYASQTEVVNAYDPATGVSRTVYSGPVGYLTTGPTGVISDIQDTPTVVVSAALPPIVRAAMTPFSQFRISSDGTAYAWLTSPTDIGWWRPGMSTPTYVRIKGGFDTENNGGVPTVDGQFLVATGTGANVLIDMRSKAVAPLTQRDFGNISDPYLLVGHGGLIAGGARANGEGRFVDGYWTDPPVQVLRVDTTSLPDLTC